MTTTINASTSTGLVQTADTSGIIKLQSNGTTTNAIAWGNYQFTSNGSVPTLGAAYNITSITRSSSGIYVFAFTTAQTNANYVVISNPLYPSAAQSYIANTTTKTTTSVTITVGYVSGTNGQLGALDYGVDFAVFGN